jgi:thiol-disulfide isomerase/thioredoxin
MTYACSGDKHNFSIEVSVGNSSSGMLFLARRTLTGTVVVDSTMPDKSGNYIIKGFTEQPDFYIIYLQPREYINLIIQPGDNFKVRTNASLFNRNYLVEGSKDSRLIQKMVNMQSKTLEKITEISNEYERYRNLPDFNNIKLRLDSTYNHIVEEHYKFSIQLIEENTESLASLMALYQQLGKKEPVFDYIKDFKYYAMVDSNLSALFPKSIAVKDLNRKVTELRNLIRLEPGAIAPAIILPDSLDEPIALSSLHGKYVVLVFWASWSSQSRVEMKRLASIYQNYTGKDLEYYQVSLDRTRESWMKSVAEDDVKGIQVCDFNYWDSPVVELYRIDKLPVIFLLDKEGRIVKRIFNIEDLTEVLSNIPAISDSKPLKISP